MPPFGITPLFICDHTPILTRVKIQPVRKLQWKIERHKAVLFLAEEQAAAVTSAFDRRKHRNYALGFLMDVPSGLIVA